MLPILDNQEKLDSTESGAWRGIIGFLDTPSGDGRVLSSEGFGWRELPLTLMAQFVNDSGHRLAEVVGSVTNIWVDGKEIWAEGVFDTSPEGQKARQKLREGSLRGVSIDLADLKERPFEDGDKLIFPKVNMGALTMVSVPSFNGSTISLVASAGGFNGNISFDFDPDYADCVCEFASRPLKTVIPVEPPSEWFNEMKFDKPVAITVDKNGKIFGHTNSWSACHIGFPNMCRKAPRGASYKKFMNKSVVCSDGKTVNTGVIVLNTNHAKPGQSADMAQDFYAHTGCAVADVRVYEDKFGLVVVGAVRPSITPEQLRVLRGSDISPDWRKTKVDGGLGKWEMVALLSVNTSGFIEESLVASGEFVSNNVVSGDDFDDDNAVACFAGNIFYKSGDDTIIDEPVGSEESEPIVLDTETMTELKSFISTAVAEAFSAKGDVEVMETVSEPKVDEQVVFNNELLTELSGKVEELYSKLQGAIDELEAFKADKASAETKSKFASKFIG